MINSGKRNAWSGYAFEQVCLHHTAQIKKKPGITGILSNVSAWSRKAFTDRTLPIMNFKLKLEKAVRNDIYDYLTK